jgi:hypothetical protein
MNSVNKVINLGGISEQVEQLLASLPDDCSMTFMGSQYSASSGYKFVCTPLPLLLIMYCILR